MNRIARLGADAFVAGDSPLAHSELTRLLRAHLPPATAALFAKPKEVEGGLVEWYSELGGQPVPFSQLPTGEATQVKRLLDERLGSIEQLAVKLATQGGGGARQATQLRQAVRYPDTRTLYSLNGQPVLAFWGHDLRGAAPVAPIAAAPAAAGVAPALASSAVPSSSSNSSAPIGALANAVGSVGGPPPVLPPDPPGPPDQPANPRKRRRWPWVLLALLLLALLAAVLWWWLNREPEVTPPVEPPLVEQPAEQLPAEEPPAPEQPVEEKQPEPVLPEATPEQEEPVAEPVTEEAAVEPVPPPPDPLDELARKVEATTDCAALEKILKEEPLLKADDVRADEMKQNIQATLDGRCKKEQAKQQQAKQTQIQQAKNQCPGQRPKELAPELIIVFDASGSMNERLPLTVQEQVQRKVTQDVIGGFSGMIGGSTGRTIGRQVEQATIGDPPTRMTAAKEAAVSVVRRTPNDTNIGLVMIENCPAGRPAGYYAPSQRGSLVGLLQSLQPKGGTPLGDSIAKAGQMLDGVNKASVMVVISDGQESCGTDPCAVAKQLSRTKPNLKINVVDIMGTGAGNCVAHSTGGRVFTAKSVKDLNLAVSQAAQDVLGPGNCP